MTRKPRSKAPETSKGVHRHLYVSHADGRMIQRALDQINDPMVSYLLGMLANRIAELVLVRAVTPEIPGGFAFEPDASTQPDDAPKLS
jgi:hypothetical protein